MIKFKNIYTLAIVLGFTSLSIESKELFFECDYSAVDEPWVDSISVDTDSKTGTYQGGNPAYLAALEYYRGGSILPTKITMTADTMHIKHQSFFSDSPAFSSTLNINRESLVYSDSSVVLGQCKMVEKANQF
jgi:hypothetical protein